MKEKKLRRIIREEIAAATEKKPIPAPTGFRLQPSEELEGLGEALEEAGNIIETLAERNQTLEVGDRVVFIEPEDRTNVKVPVGLISKIKEIHKWGLVKVEGLEAWFSPLRLKKTTQPEPEPEITPAEPLRIVPEIGERFWFVYIKISNRSCYTVRTAWSNVWNNYIFLQAGLIFPDTPEGKAAAEARAKQGILPHPEPLEIAGPLTEAPKKGEMYYYLTYRAEIGFAAWDGDRGDNKRLAEGRCYPYTKPGKRGAAEYEPKGI